MKYRITKHGQKLWHEKEGNILDEEQLRVRFGESFSIEGAIELGLLEHVPERIELRRMNLSPIAICKNGEYGALIKEFKDPEIKTMEHAINKEYGKIPGNLEWVYELYYDYKENGENYDNFDHYLDRIKANK